ncbi:MAG TPA: Gfo/Idh/MocA family oxidoreductase [Pirellulales bacterium]
MKSSRREFLKYSAAAGAAFVPYVWTSSYARAADKNSTLTMASIGVGGSRGAYSRGGDIAMHASKHAKMIAVCDVDDRHTAEFNAKFDKKLNLYRDYRKLFEKEKPDVVTIGTPDHWHVAIAIHALRAGCDVYCEKPLTLTIEEGFRVRDAVKETGRVFQVGTQQRSEFDLLFLKAVAIVKSGRLGKKVNAYIAIGDGPVGGPYPTIAAPDDLDWEMWMGPTNQVGFSPERRKEFRWFYDYSGGKMTDWGAHHIDIAQWALGHDQNGPVKVSSNGKFTPLVPDQFDWPSYFAGKTQLPNGYETATKFHIDLEYADGSTISVNNFYDAEDGHTKFENGILFVGDEGRIYVNRERLTGKPVEDMTDDEKATLYEHLIPLYKGKWPGDHMRNFFECVADRHVPISDVSSHHRTMTCCHLCNISLMLGRDLKWDPDKEQFVGDEQATALMARPRRDAYSWAETA